MKIKIYYVYQELFTLNECSLFLDIDIVHDTYSTINNINENLKKDQTEYNFSTNVTKRNIFSK